MSAVDQNNKPGDDRGEIIRLRLTIAYDGSAYAGWQVQKTGTGVQEKLEEALARLFPSKPRVHSSSRTDAGVHAMGLVVHFDVAKGEFRMPIRKLPIALNAWLPPDIRVLNARRTTPVFHARFSALGKEYRYFVWNHPAMNPLLRHIAWHVPRRLDVDRMKLGAKRFVGQHDFRALSANPGYPRKSTVRVVKRCVVRKSGHLITVIVEADGFLYKMCRGIVGTLVQIGLGKFHPEEIDKILASRDRRKAGMTAPAHGLVLWRVMYPKGRGAIPHSHTATEMHDEAVEE